MDKLSDLLPLIIILGSFIISIAASSRKKKARNMKRTMLPEGTYREESSRQPQTEIFKPQNKSFQEIKKKEKVSNFDTNNPDVKRSVVFPAEEVESPEKEVDESEFQPVLNLADKDELKRAVIYSEILHRKEF